MKEEIIPENKSGIETNTESYSEFTNEEEATGFYEVAKQRLLQINQWHQISGKATADFKLTDDKGEPIDRIPEIGDHICIDIPGPGSVSGEGDDWVRIEDIAESKDFAAIKVRPATNPLNERKDVAHFFSDDATSTFMVKRDGRKVTAGVYGRNEKPNVNTETIIDKVRNTAVATGAISGFAKMQWKSLVNGLVKKDDR